MTNLLETKRSLSKNPALKNVQSEELVLEQIRSLIQSATTKLVGTPVRYTSFKKKPLTKLQLEKVRLKGPGLSTLDEIRRTRAAVEEFRNWLIERENLVLAESTKGAAIKVDRSVGELDNLLDRTLAKAQERIERPSTTPESIAYGREVARQATKAAAESLKERIANGELVKAKTIENDLGITRQSVNYAVQKGRLFTILGPSGNNYYPAFYADQRFDRREIEHVIQALESISGSAKYLFFTTKKVTLNGMTPLEGLAAGRFPEVMAAAAERVAR